MAEAKESKNVKKAVKGTKKTNTQAKKENEVPEWVTKVIDNVHQRQELVYRVEGVMRHVILVLVLAVITLVGVISYSVSFKPETKYFIADANGRVYPATPAAVPFATEERVLAWFANSIRDINTWGFSDYKEHVREIKKYFSSGAYIQFVKGLNDTGFFKKIKNGYYEVKTELMGAPVIVNKTAQGYVIEVPIVQTWISAQRRYNLKYNIKALVKRVPLEKNPMGLEIEQIVMQAGGSV